MIFLFIFLFFTLRHAFYNEILTHIGLFFLKIDKEHSGFCAAIKRRFLYDKAVY